VDSIKAESIEVGQALDGVSGDSYDGCEKPQPSSPDQHCANWPFENEMILGQGRDMISQRRVDIDRLGLKLLRA
jgi:hypothetical protein